MEGGEASGGGKAEEVDGGVSDWSDSVDPSPP
jgi:hypothetical protein